VHRTTLRTLSVTARLCAPGQRMPSWYPGPASVERGLRPVHGSLSPSPGCSGSGTTTGEHSPVLGLSLTGWVAGLPAGRTPARASSVCCPSHMALSCPVLCSQNSVNCGQMSQARRPCGSGKVTLATLLEHLPRARRGFSASARSRPLPRRR
jgi:hypothetical protein